MNTVLVVVILQVGQFARQIHGVPEEQTIEILAANGADQAFDERMRNRNGREGLDLLDRE